jgi:hypothetical protein
MDIFELLNRYKETIELYCFSCDHGWPENAQIEMINARTEIIQTFIILESRIEKLEIENKFLREK